MKLPDDYPELLADIAIKVAEKLDEQIASGMPTTVQELERISFEVAEHVRAHFAGQLVYIPKGMKYELSARDLELWNKHNSGASHSDLVAEYGLSLTQVYAVLKRVTAAQRAKRQRDLFAGDSDS